MRLRRLNSITSRCSRALFVAMIGSVLVAGSYMPRPAEAAKLFQAEQVALNQATASCKAEAKGKKIRWPKSRTYVGNCLKEALKEHPTIKVDELKIDPNMRVMQVKDPI